MDITWNERKSEVQVKKENKSWPLPAGGKIKLEKSKVPKSSKLTHIKSFCTKWGIIRDSVLKHQ